MKQFSTWLLLMFASLFWLIRVIIMVSYQLGMDFMGVTPMNETYEIILLFAFLVCAIFIAKRKLIGSILYILTYGYYFGGDLSQKIMQVMDGATLSMGEATGAILSLCGVILPLAVLIDLLVDKGRKANPVDKKTDWYYKNEAFDREVDDRVDKNQYRNY